MYTSSLSSKNTLNANFSLRKLVWLVVLMFSLYSGYQISASLSGKESSAGIAVLKNPVSLPEFELRDQFGHVFSLDNLKGQWSILFYGFTNCPDICPATLQQLTILNRAMSQQTIAGIVPQTVFVSVDPMRDTESMAEYVGYFSKQFVGVSGDMGEVSKLENAIGAWHQYQQRANGDYNVAHSGELFVINPEGKLQARVLPPMDIKQVSRELLKLMSGQG